MLLHYNHYANYTYSLPAIVYVHVHSILVVIAVRVISYETGPPEPPAEVVLTLQATRPAVVTKASELAGGPLTTHSLTLFS